MKILGIDTSAKTAGCAVVEDDKILSECFVNAGLTHSETMMPMVQNTLAAAKIDLADIDLVAISGGPGSFTGLRIGMAAVMGMCQSTGKKAIAVSTLLATAQNASHLNGYIVPCMDARRNQVYTATFLCKDGVITRVSKDTALPASEALQHCDENAPIFLLGDGAHLCYNHFKECQNVTLLPPALRFTKGSGVAYAAAQSANEAVQAEDLQINYIRQSQAERELAMRK